MLSISFCSLRYSLYTAKCLHRLTSSSDSDLNFLFLANLRWHNPDLQDTYSELLTSDLNWCKNSWSPFASIENFFTWVFFDLRSMTGTWLDSTAFFIFFCQVLFCIKVHCVIMVTTLISRGSVYLLVWQILLAINNCKSIEKIGKRSQVLALPF